MTLSDSRLLAANDLASAWKIEAQGDRTVLLTHTSDGTAKVDIGQQCTRIADLLRSENIAGVLDIVPAFNTVALHFQPRLFGAGPSFINLAAKVGAALTTVINTSNPDNTTRTIDIPVCYGGDYGPDLADVAQHCKLSQTEVISLHSATSAYVFMLGFAPGAPYAGIHDARLDIPRRSTPRISLPAGSVAMANRQTIIYPNASPGGWHVIGATPVTLFNPDAKPPSLLTAGDYLRFVPITPAEFQELQASQP